MIDPKKTVGYCRVSTDEQTGLNQIEKLKAEGVSVFFSDEGISGKKSPMERPEYRAMMKYINEHPEINTIALYDLSRLGRNMQDSINTFCELEKRGYIIYSLTEDWTHNSDPSMRSLLLVIMSWVNQQEILRLSNRTKSGLERVRKFGSKSGKTIGRQRKEPDRELVEKLRAEGKSWHKIADVFKIEVSTLFRYRNAWKAKDLGRSQ